MPDRPPLRLLSTDDAPPSRGRSKAPPNLFLPTTKYRKCVGCLAKGACRSKTVMKTWWCRFSFDGILYKRSTGCRDRRLAATRAAAIRTELEAESRGLAAPKRIKIEDALKDFVRSLASGRGGAEQQEAVASMVLEILDARPVRSVDELSGDTYDAWIALAKRPREGKAEGLAKWTIHKRAQAIRRFGKWLEDTDRILKSPFRTVPLISGAGSARRKRAMKFDEFNTLLGATLRRPIEDAASYRIHAGVSDRERIRLRKIGRRRALVMRTIARSGIRPNELRQITAAHLDTKDKTIFLPAHVAKAKRDELVYLTPDLSRRLAALVRSMGPGPSNQLLFPTPSRFHGPSIETSRRRGFRRTTATGEASASTACARGSRPTFGCAGWTTTWSGA